MDEPTRMRPPRPPQQFQQQPGIRPSSAIPRGRAVAQPAPVATQVPTIDENSGYLAGIYDEVEHSKALLVSILTELQRLNAFLAAAYQPTTEVKQALPPAG